MNVFTKRFFAAAGVIATLWVASASPLFAGVQDYEFQLVQNEAKKGDADRRRSPRQQANRQGGV